MANRKVVQPGCKQPSKHFCYQCTPCFTCCLSSQERCAIAGDVGLSHLLTPSSHLRGRHSNQRCWECQDSLHHRVQHSCWTVPEWLCDLRETQCSYESADVPWRVRWIYALQAYNLADRCGRQPVAIHHPRVVPQQPFLSKMSRGLCRKSLLSHNRNRAALCMHIQTVSKHQLSEKFRRLFPKEMKIVKAEIKATNFTNDKKL